VLLIEIDNKSREVIFNFKRIDKQMRKGVRRGSIRNGKELKIILKAGIKNPPKTGRKYANLPNRSSAPGQYPATQSGNLLNSVKHKTVGLGFKLGYSRQALYGRFLELGRRRMAPRPGIQTTVNKNVFRMKHNYEQELTKYLGR
jgi:HK97 gp10 family phage protein